MAVAFVAIGAKSTDGPAAVTIAHPAGTAADQILIAGRILWRSTADCNPSDEAGWTNTAQLSGGTGTGTDNHTTVVRVDRKELSGSDAGPTVFDQTGDLGATEAGVIGIIASYSKGAGTTWDVAMATGDDATHAANRSVTGSTSIALAVGDVVVAIVATDTDTNLATFSAPLITASGITFGTTTRRSPASAGIVTGRDGNIELFDAAVTVGSGTVAPVVTFVTTSSQCGPAAFVRLREVAAAAVSPIVPTMQPRAVT